MPQTSRLTRSQSGYHRDNLKGTANEGRVHLYSTVVVEWDASRITLRTGGWNTATTKARMNQASSHYGLPFGVFQRKGEWFVSFYGNQRGERPYYNRAAGEWKGTPLDHWHTITAIHEFTGSEIALDRNTGAIIQEGK